MKSEIKKNTTKIVKDKPFNVLELPEDVKEALEAMERTKAARLNRSVFQIPTWTYSRVD